MKHRLIILGLFIYLSVCVYAVDANLQVLYDFGSEYTNLTNQRSNRARTMFEFFHPDNWGSTYMFTTMDFSINKKDPKNCPFGSYMEITRSLNFWQQTKAKDLSIHVEYNGGLGIYGGRVVEGGYGVNNAALVGLDYFLHTKDYKNTFTLQFLFKYIADEYNMWQYKKDGQWITQSGNQVPLQFTFLWACRDFCTAKGLTFSGYADIWGQKLEYQDPNKQSFTFLTEPELWYAVGQWFKCPNLCVSAKVELSYNYAGNGFMCNPSLGLKWLFL